MLFINFFKLHSKALSIAFLFVAIITIISLVVYISFNQWTEEISATNTILSEVIAKQLNSDIQKFIDNQGANYFQNDMIHSREDIMHFDSVLIQISKKALLNVKGMEGGFYFSFIGEFVGYSFPTSSPPIPVYGPPPRSYNIIKKQVLTTIDSNKAIAQLHRFDPAIFPLATEPIFLNGKAIGAVWTRIHIERELPAIKLKQVINIGTMISVTGLIVAILISVVQQKKIKVLHQDLELVQSGKSYQITELTGSLKSISQSINKMLTNLRDENLQRRKLEKKLHQKEKMASLGKLVAGVAHEVKTPLAIIKTRIQMWQQEFNGKTDGKNVVNTSSSLSNESILLVVREIDRLTLLVKKLLLFSKPLTPDLRKININELITHTISFLKTKLDENNIKIVTDFAPGIDLPSVDINAMEQVILNLITNSIEASLEGGQINIKTGFDSQKKMVIITISDGGVGIPDDIQEKIFDPFFTTKPKGYGLGLSISNEIIKAHGGTIKFTANDISGVDCIIELPLENN